MCKDVRNSYIVHKLGIQRVPYDIRNYAVMRVFGKMSWGYYAGLRFPKTGHPVQFGNEWARLGLKKYEKERAGSKLCGINLS